MIRLSSLLKAALVPALVLLCIVTCKKEYSYEGGRTAAYKFVGAPGACTSAEINGSYTTGVATDTSNYVLIFIIVTSPGSAEITTAEIDGLTFSTGTLDLVAVTPDSSYYGIALRASGTPKEAGTFTFGIPGSPGCSFTVTVTLPSPADYMLSGSPTDCSNPSAQGDFTKGVAATSNNGVLINVDVSGLGPFHIATNTVHGISFSISGTFKITGTQSVLLQASGTPDTVGIVRFIVTADDGSACSFYVSIGSDGATATYVLQSSTGPGGIAYCSPGTVQGTYTAGTGLDATNILKVNAYVTVVGDYTISTTQMNGIIFSASGTFTTLGAQDVLLAGIGTPVATGTYTFYPMIVGPAPLGGASCGLDVVVQ